MMNVPSRARPYQLGEFAEFDVFGDVAHHREDDGGDERGHDDALHHLDDRARKHRHEGLIERYSAPSADSREQGEQDGEHRVGKPRERIHGVRDGEDDSRDACRQDDYDRGIAHYVHHPARCRAPEPRRHPREQALQEADDDDGDNSRQKPQERPSRRGGERGEEGAEKVRGFPVRDAFERGFEVPDADRLRLPVIEGGEKVLEEVGVQPVYGARDPVRELLLHILLRFRRGIGDARICAKQHD